MGQRRRALSLISVLVFALAGCRVGSVSQGSTATTGGTVANGSPGTAVRAIHDPGHVTYALHPSGCHAGPGPTPDHHCTPGAYDPSVTQANIRTTICRSGYTATVRPPVSETSKAKRSQYAAYGIRSGTVSELDHLIPLELGGSNDIANLWPEVGPESNNPKDRVENALNKAVCSGRVSLAAARTAIAADWLTAEQSLALG